MPEKNLEPDDLIRLLEDWQSGNQAAFDQLVDLIYDDLVTIARSLLRRGPRTPTLGTGTVVHDAVVQLMRSKGLEFEHRGAFFALVARIMRNTLIDRARRREAPKHGGDLNRVPETALLELANELEIDHDRVLDVDVALEKLTEESETAAKIIELRLFLNMTQEETAEVLSIGRSKVTRDYKTARKWLARELGEYRNGDSEDDSGE